VAKIAVTNTSATINLVIILASDRFIVTLVTILRCHHHVDIVAQHHHRLIPYTGWPPKRNPL